ncbi:MULTISPECIES: DUF167 family protein [Sphingomonadales]|uniref:UPF0235 protein BHE75_04027 n=1 Tax=Edaphosphingomonas haloaromaticamans TaxID=653954 RepID=A0A1S1HJJ5_9SPHN|nr:MULTISPECIES: DUF167 family protein [Sphingomonas]AGH49375.1 hypothetical protein G432_08250 [Sphingomonas sp. MM-1]MDX3885940.1 DUF167 family protein [Sphingomonas sp.]OHT22012.1 hypothetical protein BHE75_04027 [Sphingomonas haloaromaticamans]
MQLAVRVTPRGGRDQVAGLWRDAAGRCYLAVKVAAAPADGAANDAVRALLAKRLGLARGDVALVHGATSREKRFRLAGDPAALAKKLAELGQAE